MKLFEDVLLFDRTKLGRVNRRVYWRTIVAYVLIFLTAFVVPFETAYRLEMAPDSLFVAVCVNAWVLLFLLSVMPLWRLTRRRLHDADLSSWWQWLLWLPMLGWAILFILLLLPSSSGLNRFDSIPGDDEISR